MTMTMKLAADDTESGGSTCADCGASIERDPEGETNRTWHHNDGDKHDHEAKPSGGDKESRRRTATWQVKRDGGIYFQADTEEEARAWMQEQRDNNRYNMDSPSWSVEEKDFKASARTAASLNDLMEFDHPVVSDGNGNVTDAPSNIYAPEVSVDLDDEGQMTSLDPSDIYVSSPWMLLNGFSGQDRYPGPIMHPSEFVGGGLETYIRENPGVYATVVVTGIGGPEDDDDAVGWAVAYMPKESRRAAIDYPTDDDDSLDAADFGGGDFPMQTPTSPPQSEQEGRGTLIDPNDAEYSPVTGQPGRYYTPDRDMTVGVGTRPGARRGLNDTGGGGGGSGLQDFPDDDRDELYSVQPNDPEPEQLEPSTDRPFEEGGYLAPVADYLNRFRQVPASKRTAADDEGGNGGQTCSVCGASIERDPPGEDPRTWHHNDGESHDHEAKPGGGDKESRKRAVTEFEVQGNYGQGWEMVTTEETKEAADEQKRTYDENEPGTPHRVKRVEARRKVAAEEVPDDYPVKVLKPGTEAYRNAKDLATCGTCGRSWDDAVVTGITPAPSARCPFEYYHDYDDDDDDGYYAMRKGAPFADYKDFADCVAKNGDKDDPEAYCGKIKHQVEDSKSAKTAEVVGLGTCEVCGGPGDIFTLTEGGPCMTCVKARARAATTGGRCVCGRKAIPGPEAGGARPGARKWIPCERCLGVIRQTGVKTSALNGPFTTGGKNFDSLLDACEEAMHNKATVTDASGKQVADYAQGRTTPVVPQKASSKTALSLTNVGIDGPGVGIGTDPSGNRVKFRLSEKDEKDLKGVLYSDLAVNFSGVDIDEGDIIKDSRKQAEHKTEGPYKVQVAGSGEMVWSENALRFDTEEEAKAYASDLLGRWFGADMARVVSSDTPTRAAVDTSDPAIVINYRTGMRRRAMAQISVHDLKAGDVLVTPDGQIDRQNNRVAKVGGFSGMWVIDFTNGTSTPPLGNGMVTVLREAQRGRVAALSRNCENGNHSICTGSSCTCSCHKKGTAKDMSGACGEGDHDACQMSHGLGDDDCQCPVCRKKTGRRQATRKSGSAWIAEMVKGDVAGTTFIIEVQGSRAADELISKLRAAGWETSSKEFSETVEEETDYDGGMVSDDIYSILVFRSDLDYESAQVDDTYDQLATLVEGSRNYASRRHAARSLSEIASEIRRDWKNVEYSAAPYLDAMRQLDTINDNYGADSAKSIVAYFLVNASKWRGETAKRIKAELRAMGSKRAVTEGSDEDEGAHTVRDPRNPRGLYGGDRNILLQDRALELHDEERRRQLEVEQLERSSARSDYAHWNEDQDYMWYQEEGRFAEEPPEYDDDPYSPDEPGSDHDVGDESFCENCGEVLSYTVDDEWKGENGSTKCDSAPGNGYYHVPQEDSPFMSDEAERAAERRQMGFEGTARPFVRSQGLFGFGEPDKWGPVKWIPGTPIEDATPVDIWDEENDKEGALLTQAMPNPADYGVQVGDIFHDTWGYDQTNVDWYEVTGLTGASVRMRPIAHDYIEDGPGAMTGKSTPRPGEFTGPEFTKRIYDYDGEVHVNSPSGYGSCSPWDGTPKRESSYA